MEESKKYGHQHPLLLLSHEHELISNPSGVSVSAHCARCGDKVSTPCFRCVDDCRFYLHKVCAEAPLELDHPFHQEHPLVLTDKAPYPIGWWGCNFCGKECKKFVYHCSCQFDFHIRCALFTFNMAENNLKELEHVALQPPLVSSKNEDDKQLKNVAKCFGCREPLGNYTYFSPDCGFNLHKKCAELPLKLNHMCHGKIPLLLQFNSDRLSCKTCQVNLFWETGQVKGGMGFVYVCSKFALHIECALPSPIVEDKSHPHPFILFWRRVPFMCDACGSEGNHVAYTCGTCGVMLHKKCISLPRIIKSKWHDHRLFHKYFFYQEDFGCLDCLICHDEVNIEHGSYSCSKCNVIFHVKCALKDKDSYSIVEDEEDESLDVFVSSIIDVLEQNDAGAATVIQHFKHIHHLMLSNKVSEYENKCCDGCVLPISASFYYCLQCDFFLHKVCAEISQVKHVWYHRCQKLLQLTSDEGFICGKCDHESKAFAYKCEDCRDYICLRCVFALTPGAQTCLGHEHPLLFYKDYEGQCRGCGDDDIEGLFRCKKCNFSLDHKCFSLPITVKDKCDEHLLSLTSIDNNSYSESHYCDICEESRDSELWFYHCATCRTSAHVDCVLGKLPFLKLGSIYNLGKETHEHPVTLVKKIYYYPNCSDCGKPCVDLSLECTKSGCNYICHFTCP